MEVASCRYAESCWWAGAVEAEGTASREDWTWAEEEACIAVATAVAGAKPVRPPWPIHGAVGRTGSLWVALRSTRSDVAAGNVS